MTLCDCGCGEAVRTRGRRFATGHHMRLKRPTLDDQKARFESKIVKSTDENGCWTLTLRSDSTGYIGFDMGNQKHRAHRVVYEWTNGPIPDGMFVCHRCDNKRCVRPDHLFLGTHQDNMRDMVQKGRNRRVRTEWNKDKTHCIHGHEFTPQNTRWSTSRGRPMRNCRACKREWARQHDGYYERHGAA